MVDYTATAFTALLRADCSVRIFLTFIII